MIVGIHSAVGFVEYIAVHYDTQEKHVNNNDDGDHYRCLDRSLFSHKKKKKNCCTTEMKRNEMNNKIRKTVDSSSFIFFFFYSELVSLFE